MINNASKTNDLDRSAAGLGMGGYLAPERDDTSYRKRMERRQQVQRQRVEERNKESGLVMVFTGQGKGKTTASLGLVLRTLGHGKRVAVIQFIKGSWEPGEARALQVFGDRVVWRALGEGFTWETQDRARDQHLVREAWRIALNYLRDAKIQLVVLDEINVAIKLGYITVETVLAGVRERPRLTHVVLTGRGAPSQLIENADLVTEMTLIHHPFREQGVKAQVGVEF
ncbi:cob(I)yrinic acid a,c-diamide adenosyltransferase [Synechococcus sp. M16CYN]|uniref:cob(I)yrinic acid a,c-diamide adenosyltransferase n=1 Tax=Synechococcus sp. M16CYN TaxID=3103139 RepID=UPI00324F6CA4